MYIRKNIHDQNSDIQLTNNGVVDTIYNGIPDWVYEEEILSTNNAMYFNSQGNKLGMISDYVNCNNFGHKYVCIAKVLVNYD